MIPDELSMIAGCVIVQKNPMLRVSWLLTDGWTSVRPINSANSSSKDHEPSQQIRSRCQFAVNPPEPRPGHRTALRLPSMGRRRTSTPCLCQVSDVVRTRHQGGDVFEPIGRTRPVIEVWGRTAAVRYPEGRLITTPLRADDEVSLDIGVTDMCRTGLAQPEDGGLAVLSFFRSRDFCVARRATQHHPVPVFLESEQRSQAPPTGRSSRSGRRRRICSPNGSC